ncbi:MAG: hypothetical protein OQK11_06640 [Thiovulaceae bacterium]|nr:hypothetical protein [Sulfurimonadaceae bacterium]
MEAKEMIMFFSTLLVIVGWILTHFLNRKNDRQQKQRELRTKYFIETYNRLNRIRTYQSVLELDESLDLLMQCIYDTELFGSKHQIKLARELGKDLETGTGKLPSLNELLNDIRNSLRVDIGLEEEPENAYYFVLPKKNSNA